MGVHHSVSSSTASCKRSSSKSSWMCSMKCRYISLGVISLLVVMETSLTSPFSWSAQMMVEVSKPGMQKWVLLLQTHSSVAMISSRSLLTQQTGLGSAPPFLFSLSKRKVWKAETSPKLKQSMICLLYFCGKENLVSRMISFLASRMQLLLGGESFSPVRLVLQTSMQTCGVVSQILAISRAKLLTLYSAPRVLLTLTTACVPCGSTLRQYVWNSTVLSCLGDHQITLEWLFPWATGMPYTHSPSPDLYDATQRSQTSQAQQVRKSLWSPAVPLSTTQNNLDSLKTKISMLAVSQKAKVWGKPRTQCVMRSITSILFSFTLRAMTSLQLNMPKVSTESTQALSHSVLPSLSTWTSFSTVYSVVVTKRKPLRAVQIRRILRAGRWRVRVWVFLISSIYLIACARIIS